MSAEHLSEAEAYNRVVYYLAWVCEGDAEPEWLPDSRPLIAWLVRRPMRLYVVLSRMCPQQLLVMLDIVWPTVAQGLMTDAGLDAMDARRMPMFGREAYARRAYAARSESVASLREMVVHLWRTGGRFIISGGQDVRDLVDEEQSALENIEMGIRMLEIHVLRTPNWSDEQIVRVARADFANRFARHPEASREASPATVNAWSQRYVTLGAVPEGRRRATASAAWDVLARAAKDLRANGMHGEALAAEWTRLADTLLDLGA